MVVKLENNIKDVEVLVEYRYLNLIWIKIFNLVMSAVGILTPVVLVINDIKNDPGFYSHIFISGIFILMMIGLIVFAAYTFFSIIPKLLRKRFRKIAINSYNNKKQFFSTEKVITIKDKYIEIDYDNKKFNILLNKNILVDQFKGYIIISSVFLNSKIIKVYPLVIPFTIFESEKNKEEFIKEIEEKKKGLIKVVPMSRTF